jgi:biopolymer transport protein ExbD
MIGSTIFHEKKKQPFAAKLSLISLMDIFTILVFFLLLNSGDSDTIETADFVELPDSSSGIAPHTDLQIIISGDKILLGDKVIALVTDVLSSPERVISPLADELKDTTVQMGELSAYEKDTGLAITISGDRSVSYALLKKVMTTCQQNNYRNISLAVNRTGADDPVEQKPDGAESSLIVNRIGGVD